MKAREFSQKVNYWRLATLMVSGWYLFEVALHYFLQRPLWNDEQVVFNSIVQFSSAEIFTRPLLHDQIFPRCYLWIIKSFSGFFENSLLSFRFFSLFPMVAGFFVWSAIARREIKNERLLFLFHFSWAASIMLVYYAAELKQYSLDVLMAGLFILFLQRERELSRGQSVAILCLLPFLGLFSYVPFFLLVFPLWNLSCAAMRDATLRRILVLFIVLSLIAVFCLYWFDLRLRNRELVSIYSDHFIAVNSPSAFLQTFGEGMNNFMSRWFASKPSWIRVITRFFIVFGLVEMFLALGRKFRENDWKFHTVAMVAPVLFLEMIFLSAMSILPFRLPRVVLFFCPILFLLTVLSFERIERKWPRCSFVLQAMYGLFLCLIAVGVTQEVAGGNLFMEIKHWMH